MFDKKILLLENLDSKKNIEHIYKKLISSLFKVIINNTI